MEKTIKKLKKLDYKKFEILELVTSPTLEFKLFEVFGYHHVHLRTLISGNNNKKMKKLDFKKFEILELVTSEL